MTTMSGMDIKDFLLARIAEDEAAADWVAMVFPDGDVTPLFRRVLAECAAKRAIIGPPMAEELKAWSHGVDPSPHALRALASVYADHPDHQEEWAQGFQEGQELERQKQEGAK